MDFLNNMGFSDVENALLEASIPKKLQVVLNDNANIVIANFNYLKSIGITNCADIFSKFYELFLLDISTFKNIFDKYDPTDLVAKIAKNVNIIEVL